MMRYKHPGKIRNSLLAFAAMVSLPSCSAEIIWPEKKPPEPTHQGYLPNAAPLATAAETRMRLRDFSSPLYQSWFLGRDPSRWPMYQVAETTEQLETLHDILPPAPFKRDTIEEIAAVSADSMALAAAPPEEMQPQPPEECPTTICVGARLALTTALQPAQAAPAPQTMQEVVLSTIPVPHRKPAYKPLQTASQALPLPRRKPAHLGKPAKPKAVAPAIKKATAPKAPQGQKTYTWQNGTFTTDATIGGECMPWQSDCPDPAQLDWTPLK